MLAAKNKEIKKAYNELLVISKNEKTRMDYEAREAEIHDQKTRIKTAIEEGIKEGMEKGKIAIARNLLDILDDETIALKTGFSIEQIKKLRQ